jgi:hypothetical protein
MRKKEKIKRQPIAVAFFIFVHVRSEVSDSQVTSEASNGWFEKKARTAFLRVTFASAKGEGSSPRHSPLLHHLMK